MVELVPASETLRKIQGEYGVTGSFKDKPLAEWLRKYNPAEEEYEKVRNIVMVFVAPLSWSYMKPASLGHEGLCREFDL